jgi:hypothetical protein
VQLLAICIANLFLVTSIVVCLHGGFALIRSAAVGQNDFVQLYIGAELVGTSGLYDKTANQQWQARLTGSTSEAVLYTRLPFYALLLRQFLFLPYNTAYLTFQVFNLSCMAAFVWFFSREFPLLPLLACLSVALICTVLNGQDTAILVLAYSGFYLLSSRGKTVWAGLILSACLIKPHLFFPTAVAIFVRREWGAAFGAAVGTVVLLAVSFLGQGLSWPVAYIEHLRAPAIHPATNTMPNLHGLAVACGAPMWVEAVVGLVVVTAIVLIAWRVDRATTYSAALVCGLLLSWHAYAADALLLLPALAIQNRVTAGRWAKLCLHSAANPGVALITLAGIPVLPALLLACVALMVRDGD